MGRRSTEQLEAEAKLFAHAAQVLDVHHLLLSDELRNRTFFEALKSVVTPKSAVLDIGSGSGVWAITAAMLGAQRVVAIERDVILIGLIRRLAYDNGVADRVEVINGDSREVQLDRDFDVVVSETIGNVIFEEQIVPIMADARERFLKPGGSLIPRRVTLLAAPASYPQPARLPVGTSGSFEYFNSLALNSPLALLQKDQVRFVGEAKTLVDVDLASIAGSLDLTNLTATWRIENVSPINCFVVWANIELTDEISISTFDSTSWSIMIYRIESFERQSGELEFTLSLTSETNYWNTRFVSGDSQEVRTYSPAKAATELVVLGRTDAKVLNHLQQIGLLGHTI
ncbi:MAG TPA: 50S ribosomal protein L11 methyltransferase [Pyrinomonadaceae bacterium]|nr:50S ribosomal protein L11 methyltransferase [Pyrinomonadaceae bacterium]